MYRENALQFFVGNVSLVLYQISGFVCSVVEVVNSFGPFLADNRVVFLFHCRSEQTERHCIGQSYPADGVNESTFDLAEVLIISREYIFDIVSYDYEIKRRTAAEIRKLLETSQRTHIVPEVFSKLVPYKNQGFQVIFPDNGVYPFGKTVRVERKRFELAFFSDFHYLVHYFLKTGSAV